MAELELPNPEELREIKDKTFSRRVALVTAVFAVLLAITSLGGNNAMKEMILAQQQASDQWGFYQAKAIREHLYRSQRVHLEMDLLAGAQSMTPDVKKQLEANLKKMSEEEERYGREKKAIEEEAKTLEAERDKNRTKDPYFDYGEVLLQIAIVMASIAIISSSRLIFCVAACSAFLGTLFSVNGFLLLVDLPFLK